MSGFGKGGTDPASDAHPALPGANIVLDFVQFHCTRFLSCRASISVSNHFGRASNLSKRNVT